MRELESHLGLKLLKPEEEEDIDTLGGLVFALLGRVPARGELIRHPAGLEFEVLDADPRRVKKLRIHHRAGAPRTAADPGQGLTGLATLRLVRSRARLSPRARSPVKEPMPADVSIKALAERLRGLRGWRRRAAAFAAGAVSVLAMAPFFAWPVLWITLPALVWLIDGRHPREGGTHATSARCRRRGCPPRAGRGRHGAGMTSSSPPRSAGGSGSAISSLGLFWIGEAFLVEAETFAVLLPFAVTLLPAGLALFYGAAAGLAARFWSAGARRVLVLALTLSAAEWLRGHVLSGFPWNTLGYALTFPLPLMQSAAVLGIYGLTLVAVLIFALPPVLWREAPAGLAGRRVRAAALAVALVPLAAMALLGQVRLALASQTTVPGVKIRIVQPSVPQREKWRPENQGRIFLDHLALSATSPAGATDNLAGITHVIWPEAAMPFLPLDHPEVRAAIGRALPPGHVPHHGSAAGGARAARLAAAAAHLQQHAGVRRGGIARRPATTRSISCRSASTCRCSRCWKRSGCSSSPALRGGFDVGVTPRPLLHVPRLPAAAPLICYEAIFPGAVVQGARAAGPACSTSPTTAGSATRRGRASTCTRPACAPSRRGSRSCARPTTAFRPPSTATGASWRGSISTRAGRSTWRCRRHWRLRPTPAWGICSFSRSGW